LVSEERISMGERRGDGNCEYICRFNKRKSAQFNIGHGFPVARFRPTPSYAICFRSPTPGVSPFHPVLSQVSQIDFKKF
jgi:hypothetical protein